MVYAQPKKSKEEVKANKLRRKEIRKSTLKKSSKKKTNSKLDREKANPNSKYWRKKCDDLFMAQGRGKACAVCGSKENTCYHHIIPKGRCKAMRYDLMNMIVLCPSHHTFSNELAPHSTNSFAVLRFMEWFKENHLRKYEYCMDRQHWNRQFKFKDVYAIFLEQKKNGDAIQF
jgi:hypothetical protein